MNENKYTPGPWMMRPVPNVGLREHTGYAIDFNEDQEQVVDFVYEEADARLIAVAPELLEALEEIAQYPSLDAAELMRIARAAIAKATS